MCILIKNISKCRGNETYERQCINKIFTSSQALFCSRPLIFYEHYNSVWKIDEMFAKWIKLRLHRVKMSFFTTTSTRMATVSSRTDLDITSVKNVNIGWLWELKREPKQYNHTTEMLILYRLQVAWYYLLKRCYT